MESECDPGEDANFGVDRFDQAVAKPVVQGGVDAGQVPADLFPEFGEFGDAAASCPGQPAVQGVLAFFSVELECGPQPFFEQVSTPEVGVGFLDPGELGFLAAGEVLGVFPQRVAGRGRGFWRRRRRCGSSRFPCLTVSMAPARRAVRQTSRRTSSRAPGGPGYDVERVGT